MLDAQRTGSGGLAKLGEGVRANSDAKTQAGLTRGPNQSKKLINAAWTDTFPAQGATLDLDFANDRGFVRGIGQGRSMDAVTFTRASLGRFVDQDGLLQEAANNEPRFDWASTTSTGAGTIADPYVIPLAANPTSNGLLIEEARTNRILWCRDATQTQWVKTNVTAAKDQTGVDGVANAASSLTATANDGTCIQTITLASGSRTNSVYLTRLIGTGNVQVSLDGSTWSTVDLSASEWRRIVISATVTNPTVGIKLATSGDAVAMDYGQVEDGLFATTPILTTVATATRAQDLATMSGQNFDTWFSQKVGTVVSKAMILRNIIANGGNTYSIQLNGSTQNAIARQLTTGGERLVVGINNVAVVSILSSANAYETRNCADAFAEDNFAAAVNGSITGVDYSGGISILNGLQIGASSSTNANGAKSIKRLVYFPRRLPDSALEAITL